MNTVLSRKGIVGRKMHPLRKKYMQRYNFSYIRAFRTPMRIFEQLEACKDEASRRILLGIGQSSATAGRKAAYGTLGDSRTVAGVPARNIGA